ncbi:hypothetical protein [Clostridium vincentii]|uniref:Uncharacterized protein n=1 Tax=Clostridium vincentii TaxID=52704 RepID=A0A2T0BBB8_9CLOT|nr:hypothetical protein [Clostridium vincentii]PRR81178.1 hypothetical protein CLVI_26820 [Clostridium vincentii]
MEDIKENKNVVTSYRLAQDTKDQLQQQLKDLGMTQEQYFNKVVSIMEVENVKQNSFLSKDTTMIQSNLDAILNAFISIADWVFLPIPPKRWNRQITNQVIPGTEPISE